MGSALRATFILTPGTIATTVDAATLYQADG